MLFPLLPSIANAAAMPAATSSLSASGVLDQAGVSVVRLEMTYTTKQSQQVACTALGTLIASWPEASPTERNNWIVTDSALLSPNGGKCAANSKLTSIQVFVNNLYTNSTPSLTRLISLTCTTDACLPSLSKTPVGGGVLLAFHSDGLNVQPFLDTGQSSPTSGKGIELANESGSIQWPPSPQLSSTQAQQISSFLTPINPPSAPASASGGSPTVATRVEPGMPYVDEQGQFLGMQVSGTTTLFTVSNLHALEAQELEFQSQIQQTHQPNLLKQKWDAGIQAYFAGKYAEAQQDFNTIQDPTQVNNSNFLAAKSFAQQAAAKLHSSGAGGTSNSASSGGVSGSGSVLGIPTSAILIVGLVAGVIFLVVLLVLVSLVFGRRRARSKTNKEELERFKEDEAAARRNAPLEARRIAEESQGQGSQPYEGRVSQPLPPPVPPVSAAPVAPLSSAPPAPPAPVPVPAVLPEQPSQAPQQPDYAAVNDFDEPTVPINGRNGRNDSDTLSRDGHLVRELRNVSLAVGSVSNVGLKRQHKPNEDSLFAVEGARTHNSQPQTFGLFVVADGMGGHANGQDASRTAIQTMIDFMLPRISVADPTMDDKGYLKLLEEGVQQANYAVHERNIQDRADMGTTMTTALVIGAMAYIANVGDSRTYLYRQSTGLTKVTRDHSVVASLVDAGIIKPDDIYTHPKRNQIYRSLGEKPVVEVDSFAVELQPGDKLLLCSDGLWDMVRDPEIQRIVSAPEVDPTMTGQELIKAALEGGGDDNVSVIVVSISQASGHTGLTGIQFLSKPDSVTVPDLPAM
jgi:serine/threonine protein phosphatase PrpC